MNSGRKGSNRLDWFLVLTMILALAIRLDFLIAANFTPDSDEAIVGLMAKHINSGEGIPTFYYGQHYMGSFEAIVAAGFFKVFGMSPAALKGVPLLFSLLFVLFLYLIGNELGGRRVARLAALLGAIPPNFLIIWSGMARGGFMEVLALGTLTLYLVVRWLKQPEPSPKSASWIGLWLGLGWWINNQIIYFILPIGFVMLARVLNHHTRSRLITLTSVGFRGFFGFFLGGLPFWIYNIKHSFVSFEMFGVTKRSSIWEQLDGLFNRALPVVLGARQAWDATELFPDATIAAFLLYALLLGFLLWFRARRVRSLLVLRVDCEQPIELFLLLLLACFGVFALSSFGSLVQEPRYLVPMYSGLAVLSAFALAELMSRSRMIGVVALLGLLGFNVASSYLGGRILPKRAEIFEMERAADNHQELIEWLNHHDIKFIRTNYWIGYRLAFETNEAIGFDVFQTPHRVRIPKLHQLPPDTALDQVPYVLTHKQGAIVRQGLNAMGETYKVAEASGYEIIYDIHSPLERAERMHLVSPVATASHQSELADKALDNDPESRWGSGAPQSPEMWYSVKFQEPQRILGLDYEFTHWHHDFPRGLVITIRRPDGSTRDVLPAGESQAILYAAEGELRLYWGEENVSEILLRQTGRDAIFDWSIAELYFYQ